MYVYCILISVNKISISTKQKFYDKAYFIIILQTPPPPPSPLFYGQMWLGQMSLDSILLELKEQQLSII